MSSFLTDWRVWRAYAAPVLITAALFAGVVAAFVYVPGTPLADPGPLPPSQAPTSPAPKGTTPLDASLITAAATREQTERAAQATAHAARTAAAASDRTGQRAARLAILAGAIALFGAGISWSSHRETVKRNKTDAKNADAERRDARFATAIEHLAHANVAIQVGGIYTLEALAKEDPDRSEPVVQILTNYTASDRERRREESWRNGAIAPSPAQMQIAFAASARARIADTPLDLTFADLFGASLGFAALGDATLTCASLAEANLNAADLSGSTLDRADLTGASLTGANLAFATLTESNLQGAHLAGSYLGHARLTSAVLAGADLTGADLTAADLTDANLAGADLTGAILNGTNLTGARGAFDRLVLVDDEHVALYDLRGSDFVGVFGWGSHPSHRKVAGGASDEDAIST